VGRACLANGCFRPWGLAPRLAQLALLRRWLDVIDRILAPSRAFGEILRRHGIRIDGVLHHAVTPGVARRERQGAPLVAFAGRLVPEKGADIAIRAFAKIVERFPDARLWIAGAGPDRAGLVTLAGELGIDSRVDFLGHLPRPELEARFARAWVQCVPSLWAEPFGLVATEAQARGTVVVASAVGALPELITDGQTGYLVPPGDPEALAGAIERVLADPGAGDRLGDAARVSTMKRFGADAYADRLLTEFEEIRCDRRS
jgi:glycosyltransferase involved in cell wall biosynthesis